MTATHHAAPRRPVKPQRRRHARPTRRQVLARRKAVAAVAAAVLVVLGTGTEQLAVHGARFFVTRPPGVGSEPDLPSTPAGAGRPQPSASSG